MYIHICRFESNNFFHQVTDSQKMLQPNIIGKKNIFNQQTEKKIFSTNKQTRIATSSVQNDGHTNTQTNKQTHNATDQHTWLSPSNEAFAHRARTWRKYGVKGHCLDLVAVLENFSFSTILTLILNL